MRANVGDINPEQVRRTRQGVRLMLPIQHTVLSEGSRGKSNIDTLPEDGEKGL